MQLPSFDYLWSWLFDYLCSCRRRRRESGNYPVFDSSRLDWADLPWPNKVLIRNTNVVRHGYGQLFRFVLTHREARGKQFCCHLIWARMPCNWLHWSGQNHHKHQHYLPHHHLLTNNFFCGRWSEDRFVWESVLQILTAFVLSFGGEPGSREHKGTIFDSDF